MRDNLVKYAPPDRAVVAQYLSIESACRAKIDGDEQVGIDVSPVGGATGDGGPGTSGGAAGGGEDSAGPVGTPPSPAVDEPSGGDRRGDSAARSPRSASPPAASARRDVLVALDQAEASGPGSPTGLLGGPLWLIGLVGGMLALVGVAAWAGVRSRPR